ncbi:hypothetical protein Q4591_04800 [Shewanella sp. 3_MG-2023]|uniref:hypothetical protein n=1 Tax=Shewanella sp. 3_MG-2023 TaxID=3062635 RepID=UPI0026E3EE37|nr:hypothetical protein [Shewanella sp. 3_MG-2023]MDO6774666.1 hypothetical protein [Shewanella sp. 3_MG-2023]
MQADGNSTSFLDVMACALGGMAMLFLILSVLPHSGEPLKVESRQGAKSVIPLSAPTSDGKAGIETPVLVRVTHPYCEVIAGIDYDNVDYVSGISWSALEDPELGLRVGLLRIAPASSGKIEFRNCRQPVEISVEYIFHPTLVGTIERFKDIEVHYSDGRLRR